MQVKHMSSCGKTEKTGKGKALALLLVALLLVLGCAGCGTEEVENVTVESTKATLSGKVNIYASQEVGGAMDLLEGLSSGYILTLVDTEADVITALKNGSADFGVLSPVGAAEFYMQYSLVTAVSPLYIGGYAFIGDASKVYLKDSTTEDEETVLTPASLRYNRINLCDNTSTSSSLITALATLDSTSLSTRVLTDDSYLSNYLSWTQNLLFVDLNSTLAESLDSASLDTLLVVDDFWEETTGEPLPEAVLVVRNSFVSERSSDMSAVQEDFMDLLESYKQDADQEGKPCFYASTRGAEILKSFYSVVYSKATGSIPDSDFYYKW